METSSSLGLMSNMRIGFSEDIHPFKEGRDLYLGGIYIKDCPGLDGHSDADVVLHALAEAILGALALGDLGDFFPDTDPRYKGISSVILLTQVISMMSERNYHVNNVDIQIAAAKPKLKDLKKEIAKNIAVLLDVDVSQVSVKACSYNKIGPIGKGEAIKATAVVLLEENK